ncbi:MAG: delta-aminolevulinic acid dehydratase [Ignavibacteriae bacterium]|nr:delta-aminolevulinic acid dehydratase [Ignavibacteriota bacterium]
MDGILDAILKLESYIIKEDYKGYDPYDSLMSPVFRMPVLKSNKLLRFGFQQVYRRIPFNTRGIFGVKKGLNPVTLGLCIQAYSYLSLAMPEKKDFYRSEIEKLTDRLIMLKSDGFSGICWGYDFDWEARYASIPAFYPTVVATGIITNSFFINYRLLKNEKSLKFCMDAANFVLKDLNKSFEGENFCYSYSPGDRQKVYNASMKGARLLSQVYSVTKDRNLYVEAKKAIDYVLENQKENGSWSYSKGDARKWVDNFHTGYVLDALDDFITFTGSSEYSERLKKGFEFYERSFFLNGMIPKYYENKLYPIDATALAQSIMTLLRFGRTGIALKIAEWGIGNLTDNEGFFYFQKNRLYTNRISYMRWVNAWMFASLAGLYYKIKN